MNEGEFWIRVCKVLGATLCVLALTVAGCSSYSARTVERMVKQGADPIKASCSLHMMEGSVCVIAATK